MPWQHSHAAAGLRGGVGPDRHHEAAAGARGVTLHGPGKGIDRPRFITCTEGRSGDYRLPDEERPGLREDGGGNAVDMLYG